MAVCSVCSALVLLLVQGPGPLDMWVVLYLCEDPYWCHLGVDVKVNKIISTMDSFHISRELRVITVKMAAMKTLFC